MDHIKWYGIPLYGSLIMKMIMFNNDFLTVIPFVLILILGELCERSYNESVKFSTDVCRPLAGWFGGLEVSTRT